MKITDTHLAYWRERKAQPTWAPAVRLTGGLYDVSIDRVVNTNAGVRRTDGEIAANNLLVLLRLNYKRGGTEGMIIALRNMAFSSRCVHRPKRRAAWCKKWLRRIC